MQEQNVGGDLRARVGGKSVVGQTDGPQQLRPLRKVSSYLFVLLIQRALAGDEGNDAAGPHLVHGFGEKIIVDVEFILIVPLIRNAVVAKGHIADDKVEKIVRVVRVLEAFDLDIRILIELPGDAAGDGVKLHAVTLAVRHIVRQQAEEVPNAAGWLYVPTDFDTKEKALSGAKAAEKGLK